MRPATTVLTWATYGEPYFPCDVFTSPRTLAVPLEWRRGFFDWARSDGVTWVYIFKVLFAAFLTLWLAMRLELPQPRTAMITVFIVMQPQSGQVFAKSFYRFLGTLAGSVVMVALIALFAQNTEPFLACLAVWVGLCSAGAARYRNFRAYGFVLAGYTAAMIGLPALAHPEGAFMAAVWRVLEISLGILCATLVSAAILPQTASAAMRNALYQRFGVFALFVTDGLRGRSKREAFEARNVGFIAEAVGLESLRSVTVFEDPHMRRRNGRLSRLNSESWVSPPALTLCTNCWSACAAVRRITWSMPSSRACKRWPSCSTVSVAAP